MTKGACAEVDGADFGPLSRFKWHLKGSAKSSYAARWVPAGKYKQKNLLMHLAIMGDRPFPGAQVDHINGNKLDNRRANLRWCTKHQNARNIIKRKKTRSGFKGVYPNKRKFQAMIRLGSELKHLGLFDTKEKAAIAYNDAAKKYFGEFANLNFLQG